MPQEDYTEGLQNEGNFNREIPSNLGAGGGTSNSPNNTSNIQNIDLAGFLGGNPYYNTGAAGGSTTTTGGNTTTTTSNPPVVSGTGSSGITADMILNNPHFRPEDIDKLNFDENGNLIIDFSGLGDSFLGGGIPTSTLSGVYGGGNQAIDYNKFMGGGTTTDTTTSETVEPVAPVTGTDSTGTVSGNNLPPWVSPPPPGAIVTQAIGSVTNPETGETVMVPTGGYTYNPNYNNNPYVDAVASMTPPSTPADQFNNLLRTVQGGNSNPYVQASGIASALPPGP